MKKNEILNLVLHQKLLPLYYCDDPEVSAGVLRSLYKVGIRAVEYTNRGAFALDNFVKMRQLCDIELKGMRLGIGTIKNREIAEKFIDAGADFLICPGLIKEVVLVADKTDMLCIPGCMTTSEIIMAENMGLKFIKLFPGNLLGPGYMKGIKPIFPDLFFMPTGGVDLNKESITSWFNAGVGAVGMGSKLISDTLLREKNYLQIEALTTKAIGIIRSIE